MSIGEKYEALLEAIQEINRETRDQKILNIITSAMLRITFRRTP